MNQKNNNAQITIAAIGKMKAGAHNDTINDYRKRMPWKINIKEMEEKRPLSPVELKKRESEILLASAPENAFRIALDEKGKQLTSVEFADKISSLMDDGRKIIFFIGGAGGHDNSLKEQSDLLLSLGKMTWPHMLARVMLVEQIYRSYSIIKGLPYHKE